MICCEIEFGAWLEDFSRRRYQQEWHCYITRLSSTKLIFDKDTNDLVH